MIILYVYVCVKYCMCISNDLMLLDDPNHISSLHFQEWSWGKNVFYTICGKKGKYSYEYPLTIIV